MLPYVVLAAEALVVVAFAVYTLMLVDLDAHARANPAPKRDATSEALVGGVQIAFAVGLVVLIVLSVGTVIVQA